VSRYLYEKYWSNEAQLAIKKEIASLLENKNLLLVTGAGFSNNFGYPMWGQFLDDINTEIGSPINKNDQICQTEGNLDYLKYAQEIVNKIQSDPSRKNDISRFVFDTFKPEKFETNSVFYKNLMELGFQGFATLNYDISLELLIQRLVNQFTSSINVCNKNYKFEIKTFFDNVSEKKEVFSNVLHIHGLYKEPTEIILTQSSYNEWYHKGSLEEIQKLTNEITDRIRETRAPVIEGKLAELLSRIRYMFDPGTLNSDHKKLIWLIFARYRILFVGFSADDSFFMNLLEIVKDDFVLPSKPIHYIFAKYNPAEPKIEQEEKEKICERLVKKGLWPIFYPVIGNNYEAGLEKIVRELESLKTEGRIKKQSHREKRQQGRPVAGKTISEITDEMMRLR